MHNFDFCNPTKILFGKGRISDIAAEIPEKATVLITYGGGSIKENGVFDQVKTALAGHEIVEFGGIEPNPTYETLMKCVELIRGRRIDFVLAAGGGSVVDGTKFIVAAVNYKGEPWEILQTCGANVKEALPFGAVLTLPATGSEMNCGAVVTRKSIMAKLHFFSPFVYPKFSVLDPMTTMTLPPSQVSNGVVDAFVHVMEQYLTYPVNGMVQDRFAEGLLLTLIDQGPKALMEPHNYDVRANIMWCATMALNGLIGAGVPQDWTTHMLGHEITALHGIDHARTLAIVLPAVMTLRKKEKWQKLLQYAERVWGIKEGSEEHKVDTAIAKTRAFFEDMQIKTRFGDYGIKAQSIDKLVEQLRAHKMITLGEHKDITPEVSRKVYELCL